eukprot:scaffold57247_cov37-Cyclotella_meneghiniana.AAC.7
MGEEHERKVDPKGGKKFYRRRGATAPKQEKYKAPTPGLEQLVFTIGTAEDATNFTKVKDALAEYIGGSGKYKYGTEYAVNAVNDLVEPTFVEPADPIPKSDPPTVAEIKAHKRWDEEFAQYLANERAWKDVKVKIFQLILQHSDPSLKEKLKTASTYEAIKRDNDIVKLLELIRGFAHDHDEVKQGTMAYVEHDLRLYLTYQKSNVPLDEFVKQFRARKDVINTFGGRAGYHPALYRKYCDELATELNKQVTNFTQAERQQAMDRACEDYLACLLIRISNDEMYSNVKKGLDNMNLFQQDTYPKTIEEAHRYLQNYKSESRAGGRQNRGGGLNHQGVAFPEPSQKKWDCNGCGSTEHLVRDCTKITKEEKRKILEAMKAGTFRKGQVHSETATEQSGGGTEMDDVLDGVANVSITLEEASIESAEGAEDYDVFEGVGLLLPSGAGRSKRVTCGDHKLFLDSCATNHTMCTEKFLSRVHLTKVYLRQNCNAGSKLTNRQGYWNGIPFWVNTTGIANLLSMPKLEKSGWILKYKTGGIWEALSPNGQLLTFKKDTGLCGGMPYLDLSKPEEFITRVPEDFVFIETVRKNMEGFTKEEVQRASAARDAMAMMAHPPMEKMRHMVSRTNLVKNIPFTVTDLNNSEILFGRDRGAIRGKTVRRRPGRVRPEYVTIPMQLYEKLRDVTLCGDVMFVNGLPFFVTVSRGIKLYTAEFTPSRTVEMLTSKLMKVVRIYRRGGFLVRTALMDMEFKPLADQCDEVNINTTSAREHVGDIERGVRFIQERTRSTVSELPYKHCMPDVFIIHLVYFVVMWMNAFLSDSGVSTEYSPKEIVTGLKFDFKLHCQARFGSYVEASEDAIVTNTIKDRTQPCIVLGPTGNVQGGVYCYNLETKRVVERRTITPLPMPDRVIRRVIKLGERAKQLRTSQRIEFLNRHKEKFAWDTDESETQDLVEPEPRETDALIAEIPGVSLEADYESQDVIQAPAAPTDLHEASAALANANLAQTPDADEIAGVNDTPPLPNPFVTDDEGDDEGDESDDDGSEVEYMGENLADEEQEAIQLDSENEQDDASDVDFGTNDAGDAEGDLADDEEENDDESSGDEDDAAPQAELRRSKRNRRKRQTVVDFDNLEWSENQTYVVNEDVIHINPAVIKQSTEDLKITSDDLFPEKKTSVSDTGGRTQLRVPRTAGVCQQAVDKVSMGVFHLPEPKLEDGEHLVSDHVVLHILGVVLAEQYSINKGIRLFGDRAKESVTKELKQLHDYVTYIPVHAHDLTPKQRRDALASLIFITEKRCGRIKTRACVNGSTQRDYIPKEATASPTVMNDSVQITSAIDAHEGRVVVTCDIPGAFLHADLDEEVYMLLRGQLADLMVKVDPELYGPYVTKSKKGESLLYVKMKKAMYGLLRSALLFYLRLVKDLNEYGFELNPYDPCVANKIVDGTQMTVVWHVDDLKISHKKKGEIDKLLAFLKSKYGNGLVVHEGHVHDYLGVDHDYSEKGVVKLSMIKHIDRIFKDFPDEIGKSAATPAADHLFQVRDPEEAKRDGKLLDIQRKKDFHHSVAQLLFVSTRVRRDIQTAVAFLTTRVKRPDEDDWGKLKRVLKYLKGTLHMKLVLSVDELGIIRWWVDASYNVHEDCKGQTGALMSLGRGAPISFSRKQKLNVRSSCEGELVGMDDALPFILWARYFIEAQGYTVEQNIIYQDNKSTILLANNGRWSSSKRTRHIKSRYFFIKDKVDSGEVSIEHRPTNEMWSDTLTKPKQGKGFRTDRAMLMNCAENYDDDAERLRTPPALLPKVETDVTKN